MLRAIFTHWQSFSAGFRLKSVAALTTAHPSISVATLVLRLALLGIIFSWSGTSLADSSLRNPVSGFVAAAGLPDELGAIVYEKNPESSLQVYIIGNSHRSSASGENGRYTVPAQVQTYRIAEWLIRQHQVELLLPEGYFGRQERPGIFAAPVRLDGPTLKASLTDTSSFINAELLLQRNYGLALHQVEDQALYRHARDHLHSGLGSSNRLLASLGLELDYLQERRSAAILQRLPAVINAAYRQGSIAQPRAILTIGMMHLDEIIKFLATNRIEILAPPSGASVFQDYRQSLELLTQQVGVTVIVPRTILAAREQMKVANLGP